MLTPDQQKAHDQIIDRLRDEERLVTLGGLAGTGKTYLVSQLNKTFKEFGFKPAYLTLTGKASTVLRSKLKQVDPEIYCDTIHGFMYSLIGKNEKTRELYYEKREFDPDHNLLVVDEASMINEQIFEDLNSFNIPILAVGDHGQLPPVKGKFNLMDTPQIKLETIVRQAEDNPIIKMAHTARINGYIPYFTYGPKCFKTREIKYLHDHPFTDPNAIVLCALNTTRTRINNFFRMKRGYDEKYLPQSGEPVICLLNNRRRKIFNGMIGTLLDLNILNDDMADVSVDFGDMRSYQGVADLAQFGKRYLETREGMGLDYFDWGYVITVWKSQGSEWEEVILMEEYIPNMDDDTRRRFLYTAITRAKEKIIIIKR